MNRVSAISRRQAAALLLALSAAAITACGGGGEATADAAPSETATAYASGPITGFGSVIVNGIRYDDSAATVSDDDDDEDGRRRRDELKLGMMVEVDGRDIDHPRALGRALRIRFGSEIVGPVTSAGTDTLVVLGQTVVVSATTVFDDSLSGGLAALVGSVVEVHARFDAASGQYIATRIEPEADAMTYKLRGVVADLDTTAKTFTLGTELINYANADVAERPPALTNGMVVKVRLQTTPVAGQWVAVKLRHGLRKIEDRAEAHLRGTITAWTTVTDFEVNGLKVDAATARFEDGSAGVVLGAQVEVEGAVVDGVLVASKVELDDDDHAGDRHRFELHGPVGELDTTAKTFQLRGVTVSYAGNVAYDDGSEATLANGVKVEVKGTPSADRTTLVATSIEFED